VSLSEERLGEGVGASNLKIALLEQPAALIYLRFVRKRSNR